VLCLGLGCEERSSGTRAQPQRTTSTAPSGLGAPVGSASAALAGGSASSAMPPGSVAGGGEPAAARKPDAPLNVILLTIDAMRGDMPWQGYERPIAPFLTEFAKECVVYERAYAVASYTAKSVAAFLSGRYPSTLYRTGYFFTAYPEANVFFPELLQKAGVRTMGIQAHKYFDRGNHLEQGFDIWRLPEHLKWDAETDENVTSPAITDIAQELLGAPENTGKPFFIWMHFGDPHDKYILHSECPNWGHDNRDRYDSEICFVDLHVRKLLEWAKTQSWYERTAIIIGSDHGESFGEHHLWHHGFALWEDLVHVPLMLKVPGATPRRIVQRRSYLDLTPTIMELAGQKPYEGFMGKSMVPEIFGAEPEDREPIALELPADSHNPPTFAIIEGDYKLILEQASGRSLLYDLKADPTELKDLAKDPAREPDLTRLKKLMDDTRAKIPSIKPYGGNKLVGGGKANGPEGPG
jgi:choline-sulfatase